MKVFILEILDPKDPDPGEVFEVKSLDAAKKIALKNRTFAITALKISAYETNKVLSIYRDEQWIDQKARKSNAKSV